MEKRFSQTDVLALQNEWLCLYQKKILLNLDLIGRDTNWFLRKRMKTGMPGSGVSVDVVRDYLNGSIVESENWEAELRICMAILESEKSKSDSWASH